MSATPQAAAFPYGAYGAAPGYGMANMGTYQSTHQVGESTIDRYIVPGQTMHIPEPVQVPSFTQVMENQTYMEPKQVTVKVPRTVMEDVEVSYQVPAMESRFHTAQRPKVVMEEQTITVNEPRTVMEPVQVQVPAVQTVNVTQMHHKVVEYERPRMIPGRMVRTFAGPTQTVGVTAPTATQQFYTTGVAPVAAPVAAPVVTGSAAPIATGVAPTYTMPYGSFSGYGYGYPQYATAAAPAPAQQ
jgi:hypothetical protein